MPSPLSKYEKETILLCNQSLDPVLISTYDSGLRRRLRAFADRYPAMCRRVDRRKYPDYAEYEVQKGRVCIRLLPPLNEGKPKAGHAEAAGPAPTPDPRHKERT